MAASAAAVSGSEATKVWVAGKIIKAFAIAFYEKPEPMGRTVVLELDEMWHYVKKKRQKLWIWKALDRKTGQLLDGEIWAA
jgi:hypothetical protein